MRIREEAQAVIFRKGGGKKEFLLLKRSYKGSKEQPAQIRLVKGGTEKGESYEETAIREIGEEVGLKQTTVIKKLGYYEYLVDEILHKVNVFLVEANDSEVARATTFDEGEAAIDDVLWASGEEAIKLLTFGEEQEMIRLTAN